MELTQAQYERIAPHLPVQRGNVSLSNQQVLNAILYVAEHGCKWRGLPARFGNWHTLYTRMNRWSKNGVLDRVFEHLQREQIVRVKLEAVSLDSTIVQVHPDGTGALKKTVPKPSADPAAVGPPRFIWLPRMLGTAVTFSLSPGQAHDAPEGRQLLNRLGQQHDNPSLIMDRAYEGNETRQLALALGFIPVVPPSASRLDPWEYDREMYKRRNEIERLFRRLKGIPKNLLTLREARRDLPRFHPLRTHRRGIALVLTSPSSSRIGSRRLPGDTDRGGQYGLGSRQHRGQFFTGVRCRHKLLTHQDGVKSSLFHSGNILPRCGCRSH